MKVVAFLAINKILTTIISMIIIFLAYCYFFDKNLLNNLVSLFNTYFPKIKEMF